MTLSRGGDDANEFPHGSCEGQGKNPAGGKTGCGWVHVNEESHYIMPYANLSYADLYDANLRGVKANSRTICPNGIRWLTAGNDCGFW